LIEKPKCRKNKWASKFQGHFTGKISSKWRQRIKKLGRGNVTAVIKSLKAEQQPTVQLKGDAKPPKRQYKANVKGKPKDTTPVQVFKDLKEHPLLFKDIRVINEEAGSFLGRTGKVVRAIEVKKVAQEPDVILVVVEDLDTAKGPDDDAKNVFSVKAEYCQDRMDETLKPILPMSLDFRAFRGPMRDRIITAQDCWIHPGNPEPIKSGEMIEHSTIRAALLEKEERFKMPQAMLVPPQVCVSLADTDGIKFDIGGEHKKFQATVNTSELVCFVVYSIGPPRHFTYLELKQNLTDGKGFEVAYKDSLKQPSTSGIQAAKQILINLGLEHFVDKVVPSNKVYQPDGWSCGIYVLRWIEAALRRARGEPRIADASITDVTRLTNEFISKVLPKPKAKSEAKC
jgi:hypothetical protein